MKLGKYTVNPRPILGYYLMRLQGRRSYPRPAWIYPTKGWIYDVDEIKQAIMLDDELGLEPRIKEDKQDGN